MVLSKKEQREQAKILGKKLFKSIQQTAKDTGLSELTIAAIYCYEIIKRFDL